MKPRVYRANEKDFWVLKDGVYVRHLPWVAEQGNLRVRFWTWEEALEYALDRWCQ